MKFSTPLVTATLIKRYKRFLADVRLEDGSVVTVHVPNTGSMMSTNEPGATVAISPQPAQHRKLKWTLELYRASECWVGVNTSHPNRIVEEAIVAGRLGPLKGYQTIRTEVKYGKASRIDLLLDGKKGLCYVEVKNVTYRKGRRALFPDAVTARGKKHLEELSDMISEGHRGVILFLINRDDCASMGPAREIDPSYGEALDKAIAAGVEPLAYRVTNSLVECTVDRKLKIIL